MVSWWKYLQLRLFISLISIIWWFNGICTDVSQFHYSLGMRWAFSDVFNGLLHMYTMVQITLTSDRFVWFTIAVLRSK
jgi:hypothetical protein